MKKIPDTTIQEIRNNSDIIDVISRYLPLTRRGKSFYCVCPFHDDHNPSMSISQEKQIYRCFSCGASGGVFQFVQNYEKISFVEAVARLGEPLGIKIDYETPTYVVDENKKRYYDINEEAIQYMTYLLMVDKEAKEYLKQRNIPEDIIKKYQLGYDDGNLRNYLKEKNFSYELMQEAYLIHEGVYGNSDVFKERIVFPIHDLYGNPVGFTARTIKNATAKYINTSETNVYKKGELLYNFHRVKKDATKKKNVFLVEGTMDVIAFEKAGFSNAVSTLGTAATKEQIKALRSLNTTIYVCYDGDDAGKNATYKFGKLAIELNLSFEIVDWPSKEDPDEYLNIHGKEMFSTVVNTTISWVHFLFEYLKRVYNLNNYSDRKKYAAEIAEAIQKVNDKIERDAYYEILKDITDFDYSKQAISRKEQQFVYKKTQDFYSGLERVQLEILNQMLLSKYACDTFRTLIGHLPNKSYNQIAEHIIEYYKKHNELILGDFFSYIEQNEHLEILAKMQDDELLIQKYERSVIEGNINHISIYNLKQLENEVIAKMSIETREEVLAEYAIESAEIKRKINDIRAKEVAQLRGETK